MVFEESLALLLDLVVTERLQRWCLDIESALRQASSPARELLERFRIVSPQIPFALESFRAYSRSPRVVLLLFPFVLNHFATILVLPGSCLSNPDHPELIGITNWKITAII